MACCTGLILPKYMIEDNWFYIGDKGKMSNDVLKQFCNCRNGETSVETKTDTFRNKQPFLATTKDSVSNKNLLDNVSMNAKHSYNSSLRYSAIVTSSFTTLEDIENSSSIINIGETEVSTVTSTKAIENITIPNVDSAPVPISFNKNDSNFQNTTSFNDVLSSNIGTLFPETA
ncbi:hypothetical protein HHI36_001138 [Cryptolaemus montrouzieri]|uniref:Uncharacterized protein n=1 Tax=Cryptolaemus montrouzieri TaxID=559131 RepID=A0ABD2P6I0_9CUCU